jgi:hypothetical protein
VRRAKGRVDRSDASSRDPVMADARGELRLGRGRGRGRGEARSRGDGEEGEGG